MNQYVKRTQRDHSLSFKLAFVEQVEKGEMTDGYDCYQNALAERVNGILKTECLPGRPADIMQARKRVRGWVEIYNTRRPHLSLKYKTPDEIHRALSG